MLRKTHKYSLNKHRIKQLKQLAVRFGLPYDSTTIRGYIMLNVFECSLANKTNIEVQYDAIRTRYYDMWSYLSFKERNEIMLSELKNSFSEMKHFEHNNQCIYITFFDELMNTLYTKEVAILELPQFFDLYHNFKEKLIFSNHYGLAPFRANMTDFPCVYEHDDSITLHDPVGHAFIYVNDHEEKVFPYLKSKVLTSQQITDFARILNTDEHEFYQTLIDAQAVSKKFVRKYTRMLKKQQKKEKS